MKRINKFIFLMVLFLVFILTYIFIPYRLMPSKLSKKLESKYHRKNEFELVENYRDGRFKYRDKRRNVEFMVQVNYYGFLENDLFPVPHISIRDNFNDSIIENKMSQAKELAGKYDILFSESKIFVNSFDKIEDASEFFFELSKLYDLEDVNLLRNDIVFYYLDYDGGKDKDPIQLDFISFVQVMRDGHHIYFKNPEELSNHLRSKWIDIEKFNFYIPKHI